MSDFSQHLLIDGYNVLHQWPPYRQLLKAAVVAASDRLIEEVRPIHDMDRVRVTIVFDGSGTQTQIERPSGEQTFSVLYAPAEVTADGLIEQLVARAQLPYHCTVVSRDNLVAESIRASGAVLMTVDWLFDWVERCQSRMDSEAGRRQRAQRQDWKAAVGSTWDALNGVSPAKGGKRRRP